MNFGGAFPIEIVTGLIFGLLSGLAVFLLGGRWSKIRFGDSWAAAWIAASALWVAVATWVSAWEMSSASESLVYFRAWIGSVQGVRGVHVGFLEDPLGVAMASWAAVISLLFVGAESRTQPSGSESSSRKSHRAYAGVAFAMCGAVLAWISLTPWLTLVGIWFSVMGGFLALGSEWNQTHAGARFGTRALAEGWVALLVIALGCIILSSSGLFLRYDDWVIGEQSFGLRLGSAAVALGALLVFRSFPFLGWAAQPSRASIAARVFIGQVLPGLAALALLIRMEPLLRAGGILPALGAIALSCAALSVMSGLFQREWSQGLQLWVSSLFLVGAACIAWGSVAMAVYWTMGVLPGVVAVAIAGGWLTSPRIDEATGARAVANGMGIRTARWVKTLLFLGVASSAAWVGFTSSAGTTGMFRQVASDPAMLSGAAVSLFLVSLLGWKLAWAAAQMRQAISVHWAAVLAAFCCALLGFGWVWDGTLTGGLVDSGTDRLWRSLLHSMVGVLPERTSFPEHSVQLADASYWSVTALGLAAAAWSASRWEHLFRRFPRFSGFVSNAYRLDAAASWARDKTVEAARSLESVLEDGIWSKAFGRAIPRALMALARGVVRVDFAVLKAVDLGIRKVMVAAVVPLRAMQNGNTQWYLFFMMGGLFVLLLHLLKGAWG